MDVEDSIPRRCPNCGHDEMLERAADVRRDGTELHHPLDITMPSYALWSVIPFLGGALMLLGLGTEFAGGNPSADVVGSVLQVGAAGLGMLGFVDHRRNVAQMRAVEGQVRALHEQAIYCGTCECVYFATRELPPAIQTYVALDVNDYRRELWYACGFSRTI